MVVTQKTDNLTGLHGERHAVYRPELLLLTGCRSRLEDFMDVLELHPKFKYMLSDSQSGNYLFSSEAVDTANGSTITTISNTRPGSPQAPRAANELPTV